MSRTQAFSSRTRIHESPTYGRVLEIELVGSEGQERPFPGIRIIQEEVARHRPQYLVINLLGFDSRFGNTLIGGLVAGAVAMRGLGGGRKTGIIAAGRTAAKLDRILTIGKIAPIFGGRTYSDLETALSNLSSWPSLAACELQIVFNKPGCTYTVGAKVSGVVQVRAGEELACRKLTMNYQWGGMSDKGEAESGPVHEQQLFSGPWKAGEVGSYPFEFIAPAGPLTNRGVARNVGWYVDWYVRACAELSDRLDVKASEIITLVADEPKRSPTQELLWADQEPLGADKPPRFSLLGPGPLAIIMGRMVTLSLGILFLASHWFRRTSHWLQRRIAPASVLAWAYEFRCEWSLGEMVEILNASGPWAWSLRDSHWYGDYINCRPFDGVRLRIHKPATSISLWPLEWLRGTEYSCQLEVSPESAVPFTAIDSMFLALLRKLPVHNLAEIGTYD